MGTYRTGVLSPKTVTDVNVGSTPIVPSSDKDKSVMCLTTAVVITWHESRGQPRFNIWYMSSPSRGKSLKGSASWKITDFDGTL